MLMLGVAFKAESDDLRESPNVDLARRLCQSGYHVEIYDPYVDPKLLVGKISGMPTLTYQSLDRFWLRAKQRNQVDTT